MHKGQSGFSMLEAIIVIIIIGIAVMFALPLLLRAREHVLDNQAISTLKNLQSAQKAHKIDVGIYFPNAGSDANHTSINQNLKVALTEDPNRPWNYTVYSTGCVDAIRNGGNQRSWYLPITDNGTGLNWNNDGQPQQTTAANHCP